MKPEIRNRFSEPKRVISEASSAPSLTQQHMKDETDINTIVSRYLKTGVTGNPQGRQPIFGDFTAMEYMDMQNAIADIDQQFMSLPAKVRTRFGNSPHQLIRFVNDPANVKESFKLGLLAVPAGFEVDKQGNLVVKVEPTPEAPKADPEANPGKKAVE